MDVRVVPDIALPHVRMLTDVGAQPPSGNRETLHLFDVIGTDPLGRVHIQITATKPNDDEIRPVLKLNDARVAATVQVRLHTTVEARRSPFRPLSSVLFTLAAIRRVSNATR